MYCKTIVYSAKCNLSLLKLDKKNLKKLPEFDVISDENIIFHHVITTVSSHSK